MQEIYENIAEAILGQNHEGVGEQFIRRFECLYGDALKSAYTECSDDEKQSIIDQVVLVEKRLFPITSDYLQDFEKPSTSTLLGSYSMIAFEAAKIRAESNLPVKLAGVLVEVYKEILARPGLITGDVKKQFAMQISESLIDFVYAAGMTENTSIRLMRHKKGKRG